MAFKRSYIFRLKVLEEITLTSKNAAQWQELYELLAEAILIGRTATTYKERREANYGVQELSEWSEREPDAPLSRLLAWQGYAYLGVKQRPQALQRCIEALELNPQEAWAYYGLGNYHLIEKNYPQALEEFNQALRLDPIQGEFWSARAITYRLLKDSARSQSNVEEALRLDPHIGSALRLRAQQFIMHKKWHEALSLYNQLLAHDPDNAYALLERWGCYFNLRQYKPALADVNRAIELDSANALYYFGRANTYRMLKNHPLRLADLEKAVELAPENADYRLGRSLGHIQLDQFGPALADAEEAQRLKPAMRRQTVTIRAYVQPVSRFVDIWQTDWKPILIIWLAYTLLGVMRFSGVLANLLRGLVEPISRLGLSQISLLNLVLAGTTVWLILRLSGLKARDLGLTRAGLGLGLALTLGGWMVWQLNGLVVQPGASFNPGWSRSSYVYLIINSLLGQTLLWVFSQEVLFRGFLLPQIFIKLPPGRGRLLGALLISQTMATLSQLMISFYYQTDQPIYWENGPSLLIDALSSAVFYLRTRNLYLTIGLHTLLATTQLPGLFDFSLSPQRPVLIYSIVLMIFWPVPNGHRGPTETTTPDTDNEGFLTDWLIWPRAIRIVAIAALVGWGGLLAYRVAPELLIWLPFLAAWLGWLRWFWRNRQTIRPG